GMRQCAAIDIFQLSAHGHTMSNAADFDAAAFGFFSDIVGGGFTFRGGIGSENQLFRSALCEALVELVNADLLRADAINGRQVPQQNEVFAVEVARLFDGKDICRRFHHTERTVATLLAAADVALTLLGKNTAPLAAPYPVYSLFNGRRQ